MNLRKWTMGALKGLMILGFVAGAGLTLTGCSENKCGASKCEQKKSCCGTGDKCCKEGEKKECK